MRFMMLMIPKGYENAAPGTMPDAKAVEAMMRYNRELQEAGVLLALDGLHPPSTGARVSFAGGKPKVTDGPFTEAKEVLGGYWMIDVASRAEAIEWAKRCPGSPNEVIEVRQVQEMEDFPPNVQEAAAGGGWRMVRPADEHFSMESGAEPLRLGFTSVTQVDCPPSALVVTDADAVAEYVASTADHYQDTLDRPWGEVVEGVRERAAAAIATDGELRFTTAVGAFVCR